MSAEPAHEEKQSHEAPPAGGPVLHRVCIQCNNMFTVTPDRYDVKQCPNCHKG